MSTRAEGSGRWHIECDGCDAIGDWVLPTAGDVVRSLTARGWGRVAIGTHHCPDCAAL